MTRTPPNAARQAQVLALLGCLLAAGCDTMGPPAPQAVVPEDRQPAWSPDGRRIAYFHWEKHEDAAEGDASYPTGLYMLDLASGERSLVVEGLARAPDWSPDGERLVFAAGDLFTVRPDGSDLRQVTRHGSAFFPRYSPHGTALSYGRSGAQEEVGIWFVHLADSTRTRFGAGASPAEWSPSGQRIVYEGPQGNAEGGNQIWSADTSGTSRVQLTRNSFINRNSAWSPGGGWIAWTALKEGGPAALWLMRADGSEPRELLEDAQEPAWAPDSERLVFSRGREGRDRLTLWSIRRDGTDLQQLTF